MNWLKRNAFPARDDPTPLKGAELKKPALENPVANGMWRRNIIWSGNLNSKTFCEALAFTNKVGELAEKLQHHPDIYLAWGEVKLTVWTHKIDGLTESDFIFAAKVKRASMKSESFTSCQVCFGSQEDLLRMRIRRRSCPLSKCSWMIRSKTSGEQE